MPRAKKDINMDLMFQKIMPTSDVPERHEEESVQQAAEISEAEEKNPELLVVPPSPSQTPEGLPALPTLPTLPTLPIATIQKSPAASHSPTKAQQIIARTIAFSPDSEGYLINTMEKLVFDNLEGILSRFKCCKCDRCKKDILALTLNSLPPRYIVATKDQPPKPCRDPQVITEVTTALVRAVIKVKSEPRH